MQVKTWCESVNLDVDGAKEKNDNKTLEGGNKKMASVTQFFITARFGHVASA